MEEHQSPERGSEQRNKGWGGGDNGPSFLRLCLRGEVGKHPTRVHAENGRRGGEAVSARHASTTLDSISSMSAERNQSINEERGGGPPIEGPRRPSRSNTQQLT